MNIIENHGNFLEIHSHINKGAVQLIENMSTDALNWIQFYSIKPNDEDIKVLNNYYKNYKQIRLRWVENWMIPLLPELEKFIFTATNFNEDTIDLLKKNRVTGLRIEHSPDKKYDLINFFAFKETLEDLFLEGNYKNLELLINGTNKLKKLGLSSISIDFDKINENVIEDFYHYGSKTKRWDGIKNLKKLKHLCVKTNTVLEDLNFLLGLKNIETIELLYCSKITTFPDLNNLKKLKKIYALECNGVENIDELKKIKAIKIYVQGKKIPGHYYET
jgi:hypothetical protein